LIKFLFVLIFLLFSCVKKDFDKKEVAEVKMEQAEQSDSVQQEKCDARCRAIKPICSSLKTEWSACKGFKTQNLCSGFLKSFVRANQVSFDCNDTSCEKTEFGNGALSFCADIDEGGFKNLFKDSVKLLAELEFPKAQKMFFSSYFESEAKNLGLENILVALN